MNLSPEKIRVHLFERITDKVGEVKTFESRQASRKHITEAGPFPRKKECPAFTAGTFDGYIAGRDPIAFTLVVGEHDAGEISVDEAITRLTKAGIDACVYTSASHTPKSPRWRVVASLQAPCGADEYRRHLDLLNGALGGCLAPESGDLRRQWYYGRVEGAVEYRVEVSKGHALIDTLAAGEHGIELIVVKPPKPPKKVASATTIEPAPVTDAQIGRAASALWAIANSGERRLHYKAWLDIAMAMHAATGGDERALDALNDWNGDGKDEQTTAIWRGFKLRKDGITAGTLFAKARDGGWPDPAFAPSADGFEDVTLDGERERLRLFKIFANDTQTDEDCSSLLRMPGEVQVEILNLLDMALTDEQMTAVREVVSKARGAQGQDLPHAALLREIDSYPDDCDAARRRALVAKVTTVLAHSPVNETEESFVLQALKAKAGVGLTAARKDIAKRRAQVRAETGGLSVKNPTGNAAALVADRFTHDGVPTLRRWQGEFFVWKGARYEPISDEDLRTQVYVFFTGAGLQVESRAPVDNTVDALRAEVNVPSGLSMPVWLGGQPPVDDLQEVIPVGNGLLHVPTRALHPHDPRFFSGHALAVNFDPDALQAVAWLDFLASIFPGDPDSAALLQEWMGYLLTHDTSKQKALMMVGRTRSGKGTIARLIAKLIGAHDVCGPSLASLGTQFGLQQMIGKGLAIISDARMSKMADSGAITESLLRITGEDQVSVPRKHLIDWNGKLPTRFMLVANTLPAIVDAGGALAGRFVVLHFEVSFLGREDAGLDEKLRAELPGILNWALEGRERLHARGPTGQFTQPASGEAAIHELRRATTPMLAFIEDAIEFDPAAHVSRDDLFAAYGRWISEQHVDGARGTRFSLSKSAFGREFKEQVGERVRDRQLGAQGNRQWVYWGVRLRGSLVAPASDELF